MLIYEALRNDHQTVLRLIDELVTLEPGDENRKDLIDQIRDELIPHIRAEESVFYNTLRSLDAAKDLVRHGYKEHMEVEALLRAIQLKDKVDADWKNTVQKLKQTLLQHIQIEEGEIFSVAKQHFTNEEAEMIGRAFENLKPEIKEEGDLKTSLDLVANMMPRRFSWVLKKQGMDKRM